MLSGDYKVTISNGFFKVFTLCSGTDGRFAAAAADVSGNVFVFI